MTDFIPNTEGIFHGLSAAEYHAAPGVSQSLLKRFDEFATPLHFKCAAPKEPTDDMEFGTICHTAVLEPEKLSEAYYLKPETYPADGKQKAWHSGALHCKEWIATHCDRPIIDLEKESRIPKIVESVRRLQPFANALQHGNREVSIFKRDEETGALLKCRLDTFAKTDSDTWIFDLKKVQSGMGGEEFIKHALDFGYHIQAASYMAITGATHFVFVAFDDSEPFDAIQQELPQELIEFGRSEWRRILESYVKCAQSNHWPGYGDWINPDEPIKTLKTPSWVKREIEKAKERAHWAWAEKVMRGI